MQPVATAWRPIGEILVNRGEISRERLESALAEQRQSGRRLGEILVLAGDISWLALAQAIAVQADALDEVGASTSEEAPHDVSSNDPKEKLETVEALLRDRQRAFLELVGTADALRRRVTHLEQKLAERDAEIARLKASLL